MGGDLRPERLLAAYRRGIFPWYSEGQPILWWSPDPRMVLFPDELKVSRSLGKTLRNRGFRVTFDTCFDSGDRAVCGQRHPRAVRAPGSRPPCGRRMANCTGSDTRTRSRSGSSDRLVGGLYGLLLGRIFFGESMFSTATDASKVALHDLVRWLRPRNVELIDCQVASDHLFTLGARLIPRAEFVAHLERGIPPSPRSPLPATPA